MKSIFLKPIAAFCLLLILIGTSSCKKENLQTNRPDLVGIWSHVQAVGTFSNILTQLELKADGSAREQIMFITTSSTTVTSDKALTWNTEQDELILKESGESEEKFTFLLDEVNTELKLTETSTGTTKSYFKTE